MTTDLAARLTEALDRAEQQARAATPGPWEAENVYHPLKGCRCGSCDEDEPYGKAIHDIDAVGDDPSPTLKAEDADHIAAWSPDVVLRLIKRDREILADARSILSRLRQEGRTRAARDLMLLAAFWLPEEAVDD